MKASIITIGDEILLGQILDTNSRYIAAALAGLGMQTVYMASIADTAEAIAQALDTALQYSEVVLLTGGLGPTKDDITKKTLADYFGTPLVFNQEVYGWVEEFLSHYGPGRMNDYNKSQACVPQACTLLRNLKGTASGMWFERDNKIVISLPGVPFEAQYLLDQEVVPRLRQRFATGCVCYRNISVLNIPEAELAMHLRAFEEALPAGVKLAYLPTAGWVRLRLTATGHNAADLLAQYWPQLLQALEGFSCLEADMEAEEYIVQQLARTGCSIACAESCSGGNIARLITGVPGASAYFLGGVVAYSNEVKETVLGVSQEDIARYGAVSKPVAVQMAQGVRRLTGAQWAVSTTGVAGPTGGTAQKPVGTVWIAVAGPQGTEAREYHFSATRERNIAKTSLTALQYLLGCIRQKS